MSQLQRLYLEQWNVRSRTRNKCLNCKHKFPNHLQHCPKCGSSNVEPLTHRVSLRASDGILECSCESWTFTRHRHEPGWECSHGEDIRANYDINALLHPTPEIPRPIGIVQTEANEIELVENGRIKGFVDRL